MEDYIINVFQFLFDFVELSNEHDLALDEAINARS